MALRDVSKKPGIQTGVGRVVAPSERKYPVLGDPGVGFKGSPGTSVSQTVGGKTITTTITPSGSKVVSEQAVQESLKRLPQVEVQKPREVPQERKVDVRVQELQRRQLEPITKVSERELQTYRRTPSGAIGAYKPTKEGRVASFLRKQSQKDTVKGTVATILGSTAYAGFRSGKGYVKGAVAAFRPKTYADIYRSLSTKEARRQTREAAYGIGGEIIRDPTLVFEIAGEARGFGVGAAKLGKGLRASPISRPVVQTLEGAFSKKTLQALARSKAGRYRGPGKIKKTARRPEPRREAPQRPRDQIVPRTETGRRVPELYTKGSGLRKELERLQRAKLPKEPKATRYDLPSTKAQRRIAKAQARTERQNIENIIGVRRLFKGATTKAPEVITTGNLGKDIIIQQPKPMTRGEYLRITQMPRGKKPTFRQYRALTYKGGDLVVVKKPISSKTPLFETFKDKKPIKVVRGTGGKEVQILDVKYKPLGKPKAITKKPKKRKLEAPDPAFGYGATTGADVARDLITGKKRALPTIYPEYQPVRKGFRPGTQQQLFDRLQTRVTQRQTQLARQTYQREYRIGLKEQKEFAAIQREGSTFGTSRLRESPSLVTIPSPSVSLKVTPFLESPKAEALPKARVEAVVEPKPKQMPKIITESKSKQGVDTVIDIIDEKPPKPRRTFYGAPPKPPRPTKTPKLPSLVPPKPVRRGTDITRPTQRDRRRIPLLEIDDELKNRTLKVFYVPKPKRRLQPTYTPTLWGQLLPKIKPTKGLAQQRFTGLEIRPQITIPRRKRKKRKLKLWNQIINERGTVGLLAGGSGIITGGR